MNSNIDLTYRPKQPLLTGKDNWSTWSNRFLIFLHRRGNAAVLKKDPLSNPSETPVTDDDIINYILEQEEIEREKITPQKISANRRKLTKVLQAEFDAWEARNDQTVSDIYYGCSVNIQSLIGKQRNAKELWNFLEKSYSSSGMSTIDIELLKLEELSYSNMKSVQHLTSAIYKSRETIEGIGYPMPEVYFVHILLKGLGPSFSSLSRDIRNLDPTKIMLDDCVSLAYSEEISIKRNDDTTTASAMNACKGKEKQNTG